MDAKENYNFVVFGDSISKGIVYDPIKSRYVTLKNCFCNIISQKIRGQIVNFGRFGNTITRGEKKSEVDVINKKPDIVLLEFGGNDCDYNWQAIANNPKGNFFPNTDISVFEKTLRKLINDFNELNIVPTLMTLPPLDPERYFKWVCNNNPLAERNVLSWLGNINKIYCWHELYNSTIIDVAEKTKTALINVRGAFLNQYDYKQFLCIDGIHPNEQGHNLIANKILEYIDQNYNFLIKN
ncbi:SGNH/GDSL hydrolase family protein [Clostridium oryzae]|uniref:GDSL-like lipase/acylhydrolase n=1 Tax=Clostridium oryzae TaxID=1450648 RepID=A0A1V4IDS7_9CLOT|nr:GDSL-type esterase/lipase family protein [Clostridium oryzae]OPJ58086.1 GDSL-like lipase/acylhydrolase [Clostridium oryzae]